jgi:hypothetical protein
VQSMARKLRGKKLSTKEARALTHLASVAAGGSARSALSATTSGKYKSRKRRRSAIRRDTYGHVLKVTGGKRRSRKSSSRKSSRRKSGSLQGWTPSRSADRKFKSSWRKGAKVYGPVPFAKQSKRTRSTYLKSWKSKGYRRVKRYTAKRSRKGNWPGTSVRMPYGGQGW